VGLVSGGGGGGVDRKGEGVGEEGVVVGVQENILGFDVAIHDRQLLKWGGGGKVG
jgi:hypothetical protein